MDVITKSIKCVCLTINKFILMIATQIITKQAK